MSDRMPEYSQIGMKDKMSDYMSDRMLDRMPGKMSDRMSENMSDNQNILCQIRCQIDRKNMSGYMPRWRLHEVKQFNRAWFILCGSRIAPLIQDDQSRS